MRMFSELCWKRHTRRRLSPGWTLSVEIAVKRTERRAALFLPEVAAVPLPFTVDAAAVMLPVHPSLLRNPNPLGPAFAEIPIDEGNPVGPGYARGDLPDEIVLLITAVEERGRKGIERTTVRNPRRIRKAKLVAVPATLFFPEGNLP